MSLKSVCLALPRVIDDSYEPVDLRVEHQLQVLDVAACRPLLRFGQLLSPLVERGMLLERLLHRRYSVALARRRHNSLLVRHCFFEDKRVVIELVRPHARTGLVDHCALEGAVEVRGRLMNVLEQRLRQALNVLNGYAGLVGSCCLLFRLIS